MRILMAFLCCLILCGCALALPPIPEAAPPETQNLVWQPALLAEIPQSSFWVESCQLDDSGDYLISFLCQNRSDTPQLFSCQDIVLSGWQVESFWGEEVPAETQGHYVLRIPAAALTDSGVAVPESVQFDLRIFSLADLNQTYLVSSHCILYPTGAKPGNIRIPGVPEGEGCRVLCDNGGCSVRVAQVRQENGWIELGCYLENKTRQGMTFRIYDMAIGDGEPAEDVWTLRLSPGAKHMARVQMPLAALASPGERLFLNLYVCESDIWFGQVWASERFSLEIGG